MIGVSSGSKLFAHWIMVSPLAPKELIRDSDGVVMGYLTVLCPLLALFLGGRAVFLTSNPDCIGQPPCKCNGYANSVIHCNGLQLQRIPNFQYLSGQYYGMIIDLSSNLLRSVPDNAFEALEGVNTDRMDVLLQSNQLDSFGLNAFAGLERVLYYLNLDDNKISILPKALANLTNLHSLYLRNNLIQVFDANVLIKIAPTLTQLKTSVSQWPIEMGLLTHIGDLDIENSSLSSLPTSALTGFDKTLSYLSLVNTRLKAIPLAVMHLPNLKTFYFNRNKNLNLRVLNACATVRSNTSTIQMNWNDLEEFPDILQCFPNVSKLTVSYNPRLVSLPSNLTVPDGNQLHELHLSHNGLDHIPQVVLRLKKLATLDLSYNKIITVDDTHSSPVGPLILANLVLKENPIIRISPTAFSEFPWLATFDLRFTNLTTVPKVVASFSALNTLDLPYGLNCTCDLDWLLKWQRFRSVQIYGYCESPYQELRSYIYGTLVDCK